MAKLIRITRHGNRIKLLSSGETTIFNNMDKPTIYFGYKAKQPDRIYHYSVELSYNDVARLVAHLPTGKLLELLTPAERQLLLDELNPPPTT